MEPLVTAEELRTYRRQPDMDGEAAELAVMTSSGLIRDYCGWVISMEETTFVVDGSGTEILDLPTLRLVDVNAVRVDGLAIPIAPTVSPITYGCEWSERGQLRLAGGWPDRMRCVQVDCLHGYDEMPDGVRAVGLALSSRAADNPDSARSWTRVVGAVSRTVTYDTMAANLNPLQMAQIDRYKLS